MKQTNGQTGIDRQIDIKNTEKQKRQIQTDNKQALQTDRQTAYLIWHR